MADRGGGHYVKRTTITTRVCFSGCVFFAILCACLLSALILLGRHLHQYGLYKFHSCDRKQVEDVVAAEPLPKPSYIWRLPNDTVPYHYDLYMRPDVFTGDYSGYVNVTFRLRKLRNNLILHCKNLTIASTDIRKLGEFTEMKIEIDSVVFRKEEELMVLNFKNLLTPGMYLLNIDFSGSLLNRRVGFYQSVYKEKDSNVTRKMATSKFEPTYARQAYPCFDEPDKKANYTVHLLRPNDGKYVALSNMPQVSEEEIGDGSTMMVTFAESVRMSTYLACFIVSDLDFAEDKIITDFNNITLRVYATPAQVTKTAFGLEVAKKVTEYFVNDYFKIPYPLPKLDLAAIPDFVSGAMEHWGLVTFRETALLFDEAAGSTINKQRIADVVTHEIAHSWFGNLVTMKWWDDLWLNEGFATYISFKGVEKILPDWEMLNQFPIEEMHPVLILDATLGSHPIIQTVETPNQITEIFDTITYNKGASILRMLEDAVGETNFQNGVRAYLDKYKYENAITQNLLDELQTIVGTDIDVTEFMKTFTVQMGYPIITVIQNAGTNDYTLKQGRFLNNPDAKGEVKESPYDYKWTVPITYTSDNDTSIERVWFKYTSDSITINPTFNSWFKLNHDQVGYYRVNYPDSIWNALIQNIDDLPRADQAHLLDDSFSIAAAGHLKYAVPLALTKFLENENHYIPWAVAYSKFNQIRIFMEQSNSFINYKSYVNKLVENAYQHYTWTETTGETHLEKRARIIILDIACTFGHEECISNATELFTQWINNDTPEPLPLDTRTLIYNYGMQKVSQTEWDKLFERYVNETDASEKLKLLNGLTAIKEPWLLTRLIDLAKDDTYVRGQDYFTCLGYISSNPTGKAIVWDYVRDNWLALVERFGLNERNLGRLIPTITRSFSSELKLQEMQTFFAKYPDAGAGQAARIQALETVANNIKWLEKNKHEVELWLDENTK